MKRNFLFLLLAFSIINSVINAQTIILSAEGTKQGKFKGESLKGKFTDKSELTGFLQEVNSPRDVSSGQASGKTVYQPVILLKQTGAASPQFFQALTTNEILKKVVIDFYKPDANGQELNYYTVTLENVSVAGYKQFIGPLENEKFNPVNNVLFDEIKLTFQKITVEDKIGKTMATDDWGNNFRSLRG